MTNCTTQLRGRRPKARLTDTERAEWRRFVREVLKLAHMSAIAFGGRTLTSEDGDDRWLHRLLYSNDVTRAQSLRVVRELFHHCREAFAQHPFARMPMSACPKWFFDQKQQADMRAFARSDYVRIGIAPVQVFPGFELAAASFMVRLLGDSIPQSRRDLAILKLAKARQGHEGWSAASAFAMEELRHPEALEAYREAKWREEISGRGGQLP